MYRFYVYVSILKVTTLSQMFLLCLIRDMVCNQEVKRIKEFLRIL